MEKQQKSRFYHHNNNIGGAKPPLAPTDIRVCLPQGRKSANETSLKAKNNVISSVQLINHFPSAQMRSK